MVKIKNKQTNAELKKLNQNKQLLRMKICQPSGIDRCDQMLSYYFSPRITIKWYKKVMFHLLDIAI